jgi:hypothetical protein
MKKNSSKAEIQDNIQSEWGCHIKPNMGVNGWRGQRVADVAVDGEI